MKKISTLVVLALFSVAAMSETIGSINKGKTIAVSGFACAAEFAHMLVWLGRGADYRGYVVSDVEQELYRQQPGSQLLKLECTGKPEVLTGALPQDGNKSKAIVTRFSVTFPLKAIVNLSGSVWALTVEQNYYAQNLENPKERKLTQNFTVKGSAKE